jgi:DNA-binding transcriptional LysR family regulator
VIGSAYGSSQTPPSVNLRQLEYLVEVVDQGAFIRAAAHLGVAQPSVSQQVQALERELGVELLERLPRGVRLTPAGRAFLPEARSAVLSAGRAARSARSVADLESGDLEILAILSIAVGVLPDSVRRWRRRYPGIAIRLHEHIHVDTLGSALRGGHGDIGIGPRLHGWHGPVVPLGWEEFFVVLPPHDQMAAQATISIASLADREWVLFEAENGLSDVIDSVCRRAGDFQPRSSIRTSQVSAAANLAAAGLGATLIPGSNIPAGLDAAVRPIDPPVVRELAAYARTDWSPTALAYLDVISELDWQRERPANAMVV